MAHVTTARNRRDRVYKYHKVDNTKKFAVLSGRCSCGRITDIFCDNCFQHVCENHAFHNEMNFFCSACKGDEAIPLSKQEIRKIRKAELPL